MPHHLRWKLALVTGAGSGLGREIAVGLARLGVRVVVADRDLAAAAMLPVALDAAAANADRGVDACIAAAQSTLMGEPRIRLEYLSVVDPATFLPVDEGYALEQTYSTKLMATEDAREAVRAVVEKRAPVFRGR